VYWLVAARLQYGCSTPTSAVDIQPSPVLTIEIIGELLDFDAEEDLFAYFRRHDGAFFPTVRQVHRTA